jgi:hypothetical protein
MSFRTARATVGAVAFLLAVAGGLAATLWYSHAHSTSSSAAIGPAGAGSAAATSAAAAGIDFSQQGDANLAAAQGNLWSDLPKFASYAGAAIVSSGIEVDLVGSPTDAIRAVVARDDPQYQGKPIPVRYRSVRHSQQELQAVADRLEADDEYWRQQGIELTSWGIEVQSNTVQVTMAHYTTAFRDTLLDRYGSDRVSVVAKDIVFQG